MSKLDLYTLKAVRRSLEERLANIVRVREANEPHLTGRQRAISFGAERGVQGALHNIVAWIDECTDPPEVNDAPSVFVDGDCEAVYVEQVMAEQDAEERAWREAEKRHAEEPDDE